MPLARPKHPAIYETVGGWYDKDVGVSYIAHLVLSNGQAIPLAKTSQGEGNQNYAMNHPDQKFWSDQQRDIQQVIDKYEADISRIEIDCSLMPCNGQGGCLYRVPSLVESFNHINGIALRIFSHRDENMGGDHGSSKRVIYSVSSDNIAACNQAYQNHDGWGWVPNSALLHYV